MEKIRFYCAQEILDNGGAELMKTIKINLKIMSQTSILSTKTLTDEQKKVLLDANLILEQDFIEIKTTFELKTTIT
jgi:hypothetical protein